MHTEETCQQKKKKYVSFASKTTAKRPETSYCYEALRHNVTKSNGGNVSQRHELVNVPL